MYDDIEVLAERYRWAYQDIRVMPVSKRRLFAKRALAAYDRERKEIENARHK